jgi:hypothetical protein
MAAVLIGPTTKTTKTTTEFLLGLHALVGGTDWMN